MLVYDEKKLTSALDAESFWTRATFGYLMAKRLLPLYGLFAKEANWGNAQTLEMSLNVCKEIISLKTADFSLLLREERATLACCPHMDDFVSDYTSFAIHSSSAIAYVCRYLMNQDSQNIIYVARNQYDAAEEYASIWWNSSASAAEIERSPVVQREIAIQQRLFSISRADIDEAAAMCIRENIFEYSNASGLIWKIDD